jgi:hypothetical protein
MNKVMEKLADRTQTVTSTVNDLLEEWGYDLGKRKPGVAYVDDNGNPITNLDLACFLNEFAKERGTVVLPEYKSRRAATKTEGEILSSKKDRHGRVIGMTSNQKVFSFSITVEDANVMTASDVGKARNFMLQDLDGTWHEGWHSIEFPPTGLREEVHQKFCGDDNIMRFEYFIHPNRWTSVYSEAFRNAKAAELRLADQVRFLKAEVKRLRETLEVPPKPWPKTAKVGQETTTKVWAFESALDGFEMYEDYEVYPTTQKGLEEAQALKKRYEGMLKVLRFNIRASEFAFWKHFQKTVPTQKVLGWLQDGNGEQPGRPVWVRDKSWQTGYKTGPRARTTFARMELEPGVWYRWRVYEKTERVAA